MTARKTVGNAEIVSDASSPSGAETVGSAFLDTTDGGIAVKVHDSDIWEYAQSTSTGGPFTGGGTPRAVITVGRQRIYDVDTLLVDGAPIGSMAIDDSGDVYVKVGATDADWEIVLVTAVT